MPPAETAAGAAAVTQRLIGGANPAARNLGNYRATGQIVPFVNQTFEWGVAMATFLVRFEDCASPMCPFDLLPSPKIEENQCSANYPSPRARSKRSHGVRESCGTTGAQCHVVGVACCCWSGSCVPFERREDRAVFSVTGSVGPCAHHRGTLRFMCGKMMQRLRPRCTRRRVVDCGLGIRGPWGHAGRGGLHCLMARFAAHPPLARGVTAHGSLGPH